jgi:hypothetical protein
VDCDEIYDNDDVLGHDNDTGDAWDNDYSIKIN